MYQSTFNNICSLSLKLFVVLMLYVMMWLWP